MITSELFLVTIIKIIIEMFNGLLRTVTDYNGKEKRSNKRLTSAKLNFCEKQKLHLAAR